MLQLPAFSRGISHFKYAYREQQFGELLVVKTGLEYSFQGGLPQIYEILMFEDSATWYIYAVYINRYAFIKHLYKN